MRTTLITTTLALTLAVAACSKPTADEHLARAEAYLEASKTPEAILELRSALQVDSMRGDIRLKLAKALESSRDIGGAMREYVRAADLLPEHAEAQIMAGQYLLLAQSFEDARARAEKALAIDPKNTGAMILLGNAMAGLKDLDGAVAEFQEAIALDPAADAAYINIGAIQLARGERTEAEATFRRAVAAAPKSVQARMALANFQWASGRTAEAEATLKEALALDPANLAANRALGVFYMATGRGAEAEPYFKTIADSANTTEARIGLADYYIATRRLAEAKAVLTELAKQADAFSVATLRLASIEAAGGQRAAASDLVRSVLAKDPRDMSARLLDARLRMADGRRTEALDVAMSIVRDEPTSPMAGGAWMLVGGIEASRERIEDAVRAFEEVLKVERQPLGALVALGGLHLNSGNLDRAASYLQQALSLQPRNALARTLQVRVLLVRGQGRQAADELASLQKEFPNAPQVLNLVAASHVAARRPDLARAAYAKTLALSPDDIEALRGVATIDLEAGRRAAAVELVEAALKRQSRSPELLVLAARAHLSSGNLDRGEALLRDAIEADPDRIGAYALLGQVYYSQKRLPDARDQFRAAAERNPKSVGVNTTLGMILEAMKDLPAAEEQYLKTVALDPNAAVAANNLAWIYAASNRNLDQALHLAQTAHQRLPNHPSVNDTLGWVYYKKAMYGQAVQFLERATKLGPEDPGAHYHLGMAYLRNGDPEKARASLKRSLAGGATFEGIDEARSALSGLGG